MTGVETTYLNYGVLGASVIVLGGFSYTILKLLLAEKDKRREDAERFNDGLLEPIKTLQKNGELQVTLQQQVLNTLGQIQKGLKI